MENPANSSNPYQNKIDRILYQPPRVEETGKKYDVPVVVILRTKDRPLCLPRAMASILNQTFTEWRIVLVNDGGNVAQLESVLAPFKTRLKDRLMVINNPSSLGMSRGLNQALDASSSEFIVVHDDDDSWDGKFLQETVQFLKDPLNTDCGGVITYSFSVREEIVDNKFIIRGCYDFNSREVPFTRVSLFRLLMQNMFPPISFLFRRSVVDKIGYFNEDLPVLNDWDFNIRCAFHYEIGVIPQHLANYHHRLNLQDTIYGNSIIATSKLCLQYETVIRNFGLRKLFHSENTANLLGLCLALGGHDLPNLHSAQKINEIVPWINQNVCTPLANELVKISNQFNTLQTKLDHLLQRLDRIENSSKINSL